MVAATDERANNPEYIAMADVSYCVNSFRFLKRLNVPMMQAERQSVERVLGVARFALAALSLAAAYLDPTDPVAYRVWAYVLLVLWAFYSGYVLVLLRYKNASPQMVWVLHAADIAWPALIMLVTEGPHSPFFGLFFVALIGAGFRWGFPEALFTALVGVSLLVSEAAIIAGAGVPFLRMIQGSFELNRLIVRCAYLLTIGFLVGYLSEIVKERRAESYLINRVLSQIRSDRGLTASMQAAINEYVRLFDAKKVFFILKNLVDERMYVWQLSPPSAMPHLHYREVSSRNCGDYLPASMPDTYFACSRGDEVQFKAIDAGDFTHRTVAEMPSLAMYEGTPSSVLSTAFVLRNEWCGRLILIDARIGRSAERELQFAGDLMNRIVPAIYSVYLVRRLRSRAGAIERARVAREIHDGAIQSLISVEMQVDVLRRSSERERSPIASSLQHVQKLLQEEVLTLRELMQQLRPVDMDPQQFLDFLADTVDRFQRDTGITASFISDLQDVELSPAVCREMARILQEALVNIRKHSGANNVLVRFARENGTWKLVVDDNGRGFDFVGRLSMSELEFARKGPTIIKERVRIIGGEICIDSLPGRGARLEVSLKQKGHAVHG